MVRQLEEETGEKVKYIVLPTFGYEHKVRGGVQGGWSDLVVWLEGPASF